MIEKTLYRLRKIADNVWTDGKETFYFGAVDEDGNLTLLSATLTGLTASRRGAC